MIAGSMPLSKKQGSACCLSSVRGVARLLAVLCSLIKPCLSDSYTAHMCCCTEQYT